MKSLDGNYSLDDLNDKLFEALSSRKKYKCKKCDEQQYAAKLCKEHYEEAMEQLHLEKLLKID